MPGRGVERCARSAGRLDTRAQILRRRFLDELPGIQSLVGAWTQDNLIAIFDEIDDYSPKISAAVSTAVHFKIDGKRFPEGIASALGEFDHLVVLLDQARDLLRPEQQPN